MALQRADELNNLTSSKAPKKSKKRGIPFERYFREMGIDEKAIRERVRLANDIEEAIFLLYALKGEPGITEDFIKNQFKSDLLDGISKYAEVDEYLDEITTTYADDVVDTTFKNDDEYYTSEDRAMFVAEDIANSYMNYVDYLDAVTNSKTKTWVTFPDQKVRPTHQAVDNITIPVTSTFKVGGYLMRFPKDLLYCDDPGEIVNCRCTIKYK